MDLIEDFLSHYIREIEFYKRLASSAAQRCERLLDERSIQAIVTSRAKRPDRLREKLEQRHAKTPYLSMAGIYDDIVDLAGVRIALYFPKERASVHRLLIESFEAEPPKEFPAGHVTNEASVAADDLYRNRFPGYAATHFRASLRSEHVGLADAHLAGNRFEIQVASVLMHAWSEVEHDLAYKPRTGALSMEELALLDQVNGLAHAGEIALEQLQAARDRRIGEVDRPFEDHTELGRYLFLAVKRGFPLLTRDPILGRVDILLDFLTKIERSTPRSIEGLVSELSPDNDRLPIVDQIVDLLTSGNEDLYRKYAESRRRLFADNPYRGIEYSAQARTTRDDTAFFMLWLVFERSLRDVVGVDERRPMPFLRMVNEAFMKARAEGDQPDITEEELWLLRRARDIRNRIVHGVDLDDDLDLVTAETVLRDLLRRLRAHVSERLQRDIDRLLSGE